MGACFIRYNAVMVRAFSEQALQRLAQSVSARFGELTSVSPLPGGASLRRFFRVRFSAGGSVIAMFFPDAQTTGAQRLPAPPSRWPFLELRDFFASAGLRVPEVYAQEPENGWLLVEDLGDVTLEAALASEPSRKTTLYQAAIAQLARLHAAYELLPASSSARQRSLDAEFLFSELQHFYEYGLVARGVHPSPEQTERFNALGQQLCSVIAASPYGLTHRDYQSRNLMVLAAAPATDLSIIDFQDATLGPRAYDLVALLRDSYQSFDEAFVVERLSEYAAARGMSRDLGELYLELDRLTVQRKLKDAGRFVFIQQQKGDPSYLKYIGPSLELVRAACARRASDPTLGPLSELLSELLPVSV